MKLKPIITSLLENDLYKYSMGQCFFTAITASRLNGLLDAAAMFISPQRKFRK